MKELLFKVRNRNIFQKHLIPSYIYTSERFNFLECVDSVIEDSGLPLNDTIVYEFQEDGTIECLGIDDGYETSYNDSLTKSEEENT